MNLVATHTIGNYIFKEYDDGCWTVSDHSGTWTNCLSALEKFLAQEILKERKQ